MEYAGITVWLTTWPQPGPWSVRWWWEADVLLDDEGQAAGFPDSAQAICGGVRAILESLDAADPLRRNPAVTGVARQRMAKIRVWAEELREEHRPVAVAVPLFGEGA